MNDIHLAREKIPGAPQAWILIAATWLAAMASAVIAPVLPKMTATFHGAAHENVWIALVATLPALFISLLAVPFGLLADNVGRRRLLFAGLTVYGVFGISPLWLGSLRAIVASRAGVGFTEAMIMTSATAMIGDYFSGKRREHWFALQTGSANVIAILMIGIGGLLGESSWRTPFAIYGLSFVLVPLVLLFIWEPGKPQKEVSAVSEPVFVDPTDNVFRWGPTASLCLITAFVSTAFYIVVIQLGFLLTERGINSPKLIGRGTGIAVLAMPLGAMIFRFLRARFVTKLALSLVLSSVGFFIVALSKGYSSTVAGGALNDLGSGLALPTLMSWTLSTLPARVRGRGTGAWQSAFAFGQFASPLLILGLAHVLGGRSHAVMAYGWACAAAAVAALAATARRQRDRALLGRSFQLE